MTSAAPDAGGASAGARQLEAILESAVACIVTIDSSGVVLSANPAARRMFGYEPAEIIGQNVSVLMPERERAEHDGYIRRYITSGKKKIIGIGRNVEGRRKDGTLFPMHLSVGEFTVDGERRFTGIMHDLSEQRRIESELTREQALFRSIFETNPVALAICDPEKRLRLTNTAFEAMFEQEGKDLAGTDAADLIERPHNVGKTPGARLEGPDPGGAAARPAQFRRSSGSNFPGEYLHSEIRDSTGALLGSLLLVRDLSEVQKQEAAHRQSQRLEAIGQLTGGVAHDFNNILTVILGNLELLEAKLGAPLEQSLVREAMEAAEMGARLTDHLLTFSRRQHLETREIDLNEFVLGLIELLRRTLGEDVDLSTALAGDLWLTRADAVQVENAVLNLAINARDAMPNGGRIVIETRNVRLDKTAVALVPGLRPGDYVSLSVSDTGMGMPREVLERAFEPFFTTKGKGRGTGLGLATIYGFAKQSNGHVTLYSEPGKGTTVNLYLPRSGEDARTGASRPERASPMQGKGEVVLVVEDDERVRRLTSARLADLGYVPREASSAAEALQILERGEKVDLVFTDLVMPGGMSGLDLAKLVQSRWSQVGVLLTSGYSEELVSSENGGGRLGVGLLRKPYRQAELAIAIGEAIGTRKAL
jgi:PAS domain S-box-containing protein